MKSSSPAPVNTSRRHKKAALFSLFGAAVLTVTLWQFPPWGNLLLYPFTLLATWFHEMGHGLAALALGGQFHSLVLYADGSGVATHSQVTYLGKLGQALVAAGGPLGPPLAGALLILSGRYPPLARFALWLLGLFLLFSVLVWVETSFARIAVSALGGAVLLFAIQGNPGLHTFAIQFLGVQACISSYHQIDYLFMHSAEIGGQVMLSDTGYMAEYLALPYWFWGLVMAGLSLFLLVFSLRLAYR